MSEQDRSQQRVEQGHDPELAKIEAERKQNIAEQQEHKSPERSKAEQVAEQHEAGKEALERANSAEQEKRETAQTKEKSPAERRGSKVSKKDRETAYKTVMKDARKDMNPAEKAFSKTIHNPVVEKTSEAVGKTVARPNAILSGAIMATVVSLAVYLIAKRYGYTLSGSETIITFVIGWMLGIVFDFLRTMITGGRK